MDSSPWLPEPPAGPWGGPPIRLSSTRCQCWKWRGGQTAVPCCLHLWWVLDPPVLCQLSELGVERRVEESRLWVAPRCQVCCVLYFSPLRCKGSSSPSRSLFSLPVSLHPAPAASGPGLPITRGSRVSCFGPLNNDLVLGSCPFCLKIKTVLRIGIGEIP